MKNDTVAPPIGITDTKTCGLVFGSAIVLREGVGVPGRRVALPAGWPHRQAPLLATPEHLFQGVAAVSAVGRMEQQSHLVTIR